jgi:AcrR family transcriptional regulator
MQSVQGSENGSENGGEKAGLGRRERKKVATRGALHRAAMALFARKGFQETRISEIADAADVSESTFFRYFDNKEGVALEGVRRRAEAILEAVRARPEHESPIEACLAVNSSAEAERLRPSVEELAAIELLGQTPALVGKAQMMLSKVLSQLTADFAQRLGRDATSLEVRLQAHTVVAASIAALEVWISNPTDSDLQSLSHEALQQIARGL